MTTVKTYFDGFIIWGRRIMLSILAILVIAMFINRCDSSSQLNELKLQNAALTDSMVSYRNDYGQAVSEKKSIQTSLRDMKGKYVTELYKNNELFIALQGEVNKNTAAAIAFKGETSYSGSGHTEKIKRDTVYQHDTITEHYDRRTTLANQWINLQVYSSDTTDHINLKVYNQYTAEINERGTGFMRLGKKETTAKIINHNPYTTTIGMESIVPVTGKRNFTGLKIIGGFILGAVATLYLVK